MKTTTLNFQTSTVTSKTECNRATYLTTCIYCNMSVETTKAIKPCRVTLEFEMRLKHLASVSWLYHKGGDSRH